MTIAMVLAVYCPPQAPAPGQVASSISFSSSALIRPAASAPIASKVSAMARFLPRQWP